MEEPTHRQHSILEEINREGYVYKTGKEDNIKLYWELVRAHYLKNLIMMTGSYEWKFVLEDKGYDYIDQINAGT